LVNLAATWYYATPSYASLRKSILRNAFFDKPSELTRARPIAKGWHYIEAELACAYALAGRRGEALKILK
jgi:hypothetical protein